MTGVQPSLGHGEPWLTNVVRHSSGDMTTTEELPGAVDAMPPRRQVTAASDVPEPDVTR